MQIGKHLVSGIRKYTLFDTFRQPMVHLLLTVRCLRFFADVCTNKHVLYRDQCRTVPHTRKDVDSECWRLQSFCPCFPLKTRKCRLLTVFNARERTQLMITVLCFVSLTLPIGLAGYVSCRLYTQLRKYATSAPPGQIRWAQNALLVSGMLTTSCNFAFFRVNFVDAHWCGKKRVRHWCALDLAITCDHLLSPCAEKCLWDTTFQLWAWFHCDFSWCLSPNRTVSRKTLSMSHGYKSDQNPSSWSVSSLVTLSRYSWRPILVFEVTSRTQERAQIGSTKCAFFKSESCKTVL